MLRKSGFNANMEMRDIKAWKQRMRLFKKLTLPNLILTIAVPAVFLSLFAAVYVRKHYKDEVPEHQTAATNAIPASPQNLPNPQHPPPKEKPWGAYFLLSIWALVPPAVFWVDWILQNDPRYRWLYGRRGKKSFSDEKGEYYFRGYELARNIWVAFVIVLAVIMRIKWPFGGD